MARTGIGAYHLAISGDDRFSIYDPSADVERISITSTGNVGVGTTAPTVKLEARNDSTTAYNASTGTTNRILNIRNATSGTGYNAFMNFITEPNGEWYLGAVSKANFADFVFMSRDASYGERMRITSAGNVGIGTASPGDFIDAGLGLAIINTSGRSALALGSTQGTANEVLGRLSFTNTNSTNIGSKRLAYISGVRGTTDNSAYLEFGTADNGLGTQRMVISQAGNVGINTASPSRRLTVTSASTGDNSLFTNAVDADLLINLTSGVTLLTPSTGIIAFGTSLTERMRITSGGQVGIGVSSLSDWDVTQTRTIEMGTIGNFISGYVGSSVMYLGTNAYLSSSGWKYARTGSASGQFDIGGGGFRFLTAASGTAGNAISYDPVFTVSSTGLTSISNFLQVASDLTSAKINIGALLNSGVNGINIQSYQSPGSGNFIQFLNLSGNSAGNITHSGTTTVSYNTSSDYRLKEDLKPIKGLEIVNKIKVYDYKWKDEDRRMDGVLAHELQEVLPYAVNGIKDGLQMQGVDYSKIVPVMVQAIKELKSELDTANARIQLLENK
jgi:hypothetical protein